MRPRRCSASRSTTNTASPICCAARALHTTEYAGCGEGACGPETVLAEDSVMLAQIKEQIEIGVKYQGYIDRQADEIERNESHENTRLPEGIDYAEVRGLSFEARQKLTQHSARRRSGRLHGFPELRRLQSPC